MTLVKTENEDPLVVATVGQTLTLLKIPCLIILYIFRKPNNPKSIPICKRYKMLSKVQLTFNFSILLGQQREEVGTFVLVVYPLLREVFA